MIGCCGAYQLVNDLPSVIAHCASALTYVDIIITVTSERRDIGAHCQFNK